MKRLRLVKVMVQPVVMVDDGEILSDVDHPPIVVPAEEWAAYSGGRFQEEFIAWEAQLNKDTE